MKQPIPIRAGMKQQRKPTKFEALANEIGRLNSAVGSIQLQLQKSNYQLDVAIQVLNLVVSEVTAEDGDQLRGAGQGDPVRDSDIRRSAKGVCRRSHDRERETEGCLVLGPGSGCFVVPLPVHHRGAAHRRREDVAWKAP